MSAITSHAPQLQINSLGELLPQKAAASPDKVALISDNRSFSYRELDQHAAAVASALADRGVRAGDRVSLFSQNRWEWVVSYHAVLRLGAVVNPLNVMLTADELRYVLNDAGSSVLMTSAERLTAVAEVLPEVTSLKFSVSFDTDTAGVNDCVSFTDLLQPGTPEFPPVSVDPESLACIAYTSGTTGRPKGAMQSHRSLLLNCAYTSTMHCRSAEDTVVTALPAPHVYGNVVINGMFLVGGTVVLMGRFDAARALDLIAEHHATLFDGVPTMYAMMLADAALGEADLSSLTRSVVGGQTISQSVIDRWERRTGAPLIELWGMTELSGLGTTHALHAPNVHGSIGVALPGVEVRVLDLEIPGRSCAAGEAGELVVRGPVVMQGYFNNPEATAETIDEEGWLHTGDVATHDGAGHFFVVDRLKDMIVTAGYNVYPAEIERVLMGHDLVALVAVGRVEDAIKGEVAHAYVVPTHPDQVDAESILAHARQHLSAYKVPRMVHFVDELPTTSSGKIMRRALRPGN